MTRSRELNMFPQDLYFILILKENVFHTLLSFSLRVRFDPKIGNNDVCGIFKVEPLAVQYFAYDEF